MKKDEITEILSVSDVRKYLKIGNKAAYDLFKRVSFPSFKIGSHNYITADNFDRYINELSEKYN